MTRGRRGTTNGPPAKWLVREGGQIRSITPLRAHQLNDVAAAVAGAGIGQMPLSIVEAFLDSGNLVPLLNDYSVLPVELHLLWPHQSYQNSRLRYIVNGIAAAAARGFAPAQRSEAHG